MPYADERRGTKPVRWGRISLLFLLFLALLTVHGARASQAQRALDADQPRAREEERPPRPPDGAPQRRIEINIPTTTLFLYEGDRLLRVYPVAVGRPWAKIGGTVKRTETPTGDFVITSRVRHPSWYPPAWLRKARGWPDGYRVPPGPENPLGSRWLSFWRPGFDGYGIHGTIEPAAIGTAASLGCVRMLDPDVEELFELVGIGTPVRITYDPARAYRDEEGRWHLLIGPDLYGRGVDPAAAARRELRRHGLDESVLEGEPLSDLRAARDLMLVGAAAAPEAIRVRWLVGAPWIQEAIRERGTVLVPYDGLPPVLRKYFQQDAEAGVLLYGRPLAGVSVRDGRTYLPLEEVAPRFNLTVDFSPDGREALLHF